jgi:TIR domain
MSARRRTVFVSYARGDSAVALRIVEALQDAGVDASYDAQLSSGESWAQTLAEGIGAADRVLVLMSPEYFESRWCQAELAEAFKKGKPIIPVRVRPCRPTGPLEYLNALDLSDPGHQAEALQDLIGLARDPA